MGTSEDSIKFVDDGHERHHGDGCPKLPSTDRMENMYEKQTDRQLARFKNQLCPNSVIYNSI